MSQSAPQLLPRVRDYLRRHFRTVPQRGFPSQISTAYRVRVGARARVTVPRGWVHLVVASHHEVPSSIAWWARGSRREDPEQKALRGTADNGQCDGSVVLNTRWRRVADAKVVRLGHFVLLEISGGERTSASWRRHSSAFCFLFSSDLVADQ
jgi:hypothetical protein